MALLTGWFDKITDSNDDPVSGALVYVYAQGTTTPSSIFTDEDLTTPAANPIVCDASGVLPVRYVATGTYKIAATTAAGAAIRTTDNFEVGGGGGTAVTGAQATILTQSAAAASTFPATMLALQTSGYSTAGDHGYGNYIKVGAEPTTHDAYWQAADGKWFKEAGPWITAESLSLKSDETGVDGALAINKAIIAAQVLGFGEVKLGPGTFYVRTPIVMKTGVKLVAWAGGQFGGEASGDTTDAVTTIRAHSTFSGTAVIDFNGTVNSGLENIRVVGTNGSEANPNLDSSGVGEHGVRIIDAGTTILNNCTFIYCDGAPMLADGAWQLWIYGGYFKRCGTGIQWKATNRKCDRVWAYGINVQKNRTYNQKYFDGEDLVDEFADNTANTNGGIHLFGGITEFGYSTTDDPGYVAPIVMESGIEIQWHGHRVAAGSDVDAGTHVFLFGHAASTYGSLQFVMNGGFIQGDSCNIMKFLGTRITQLTFNDVPVQLSPTRYLIDYSNGIIPKQNPLFRNCYAWAANTHRRFEPLNGLDITTGGVTSRRTNADFINPELSHYGSLDTTLVTVGAGSSQTYVVEVPECEWDDTYVVRHTAAAGTEFSAEVDFGAMTRTVEFLRPWAAKVTFTNGTGAGISLAAGTLRVKSYGRTDRQHETYASGIYIPKMWGAAGDGATDDISELDDMIVAQTATASEIRLEDRHGIASAWVLPTRATVTGNRRRDTGLTLTASGACVYLGAAATPAIDGTLSHFTIGGADTANYCLRTYAGVAVTGWTLNDLWVEGALTAGIKIDAEADGIVLQNVRSQNHTGGAASNAIEVLANMRAEAGSFGNCTGYAVASDVSGESASSETIYSFVNATIAYGQDGLIYHNGETDQGTPDAKGIFSNCVIRGTNKTGSAETPAAYPGDVATTLHPAAVECIAGKVSIANPAYFRSEAGKTGFLASGSGQIDVTMGGLPYGGNDDESSFPHIIFAPGRADDHTARIVIHGGFTPENAADFTEAARIWPRAGALPLEAPSSEIVWEADLTSTTGWTPTGSAAVAVDTTAGNVLGTGSSLRLTGDATTGNDAMSYTIRLPQAAGRLILLEGWALGESNGANHVLGLHLALSGTGLSKLTAGSDEIYWHKDVGGTDQGYGRWVGLGAMGYVSDADQNITIRFGSGLSSGGTASSDRGYLGMCRIRLL